MLDPKCEADRRVVAAQALFVDCLRIMYLTVTTDEIAARYHDTWTAFMTAQKTLFPGKKWQFVEHEGLHVAHWMRRVGPLRGMWTFKQESSIAAIKRIKHNFQEGKQGQRCFLCSDRYQAILARPLLLKFTKPAICKANLSGLCLRAIYRAA